jgi:hypothetical protein
MIILLSPRGASEAPIEVVEEEEVDGFEVAPGIISDRKRKIEEENRERKKTRRNKKEEGKGGRRKEEGES